jgi:hypothetical protein
MARISLDPPRTLSYRIGSWFIRRQFGELLDPFAPMVTTCQLRRRSAN